MLDSCLLIHTIILLFLIGIVMPQLFIKSSLPLSSSRRLSLLLIPVLLLRISTLGLCSLLGYHCLLGYRKTSCIIIKIGLCWNLCFCTWNCRRDTKRRTTFVRFLLILIICKSFLLFLFAAYIHEIPQRFLILYHLLNFIFFIHLFLCFSFFYFSFILYIC
jgi:hypothetical protein